MITITRKGDEEKRNFKNKGIAQEKRRKNM